MFNFPKKNFGPKVFMTDDWQNKDFINDISYNTYNIFLCHVSVVAWTIDFSRDILISGLEVEEISREKDYELSDLFSVTGRVGGYAGLGGEPVDRQGGGDRGHRAQTKTTTSFDHNDNYDDQQLVLLLQENLRHR